MIPFHTDSSKDVQDRVYLQRRFRSSIFFLVPFALTIIAFEAAGITPHPSFLIFAWFFLIGAVTRRFILVARRSPKYNNDRSIILTGYRAITLNAVLLAFLTFLYVSLLGRSLWPLQLSVSLLINLGITFLYAFWWQRFLINFFNMETKYRKEVFKAQELKRTIY
jgi:hypothetical protein